MTMSDARVNGWRLSAILALSLVSGCSAASMDAPTHSNKSEHATPPGGLPTDPGVARLAKEFEPRVLALIQRIARDKRISRKAVEAALGAQLSAVPTRPGRPKRWKLHGLFEPGHGFLIELQNRESDVQLTVSGSATGAAGCHLETNRIRSVLVERLHYEATEMGQGKRPFTLLRPMQTSPTANVVVRLYGQTVVGPGQADMDCTYLLDVAAPGA